MRTEIKMPHDEEAECELLTAIFIDNDVYYDVVNIITYNDFYKSAHKLIYSAMQKLFSASKPVDLVTIIESLNMHGSVKDTGGKKYLLKLLNQIPLATHAWAYAEIIKNKSLLRQLIITGDNLQQRSMETSAKPDKIISNRESDIKNICHHGSQEYAKMPDIVDRTTQKIERKATTEYKKPIYTGLSGLDRLLAGFSGSKLVFIAARPAIGKTSLMLTMARNMAKSNVKVGIMSIEMEESEIDTCWLAMESGINSMRLRAPKELYKSDWEKINRANAERVQWPIIVDDSGGATIESIKRTARKMFTDGCQIIFIDQLSKIKGTRLRTKFDEVTEVVEALGVLKKELRIPIVVLAQINRQGGEAQTPGLSHLKNTGQIEEEADVVLIINREEVLNPLPKNKVLFPSN